MHKIICILAIALLVGCGDTKPPNSTATKNNLQDIEQQPKSVPVTVTIVSKHIIPNIKRGLDVRIDKKITKEVLADVAVKIKNSDPTNYKRTFIGYYLPGMVENAGAWATTHFDPNLEVRILGLTIREEKFLREFPNDSTHKIMGSWIEELIKRRTTIFTKNGKTYIEHVYTDGNSRIRELIEKKSGTGLTFHETEANQSKDYYLIDNHGDLHVSDGVYKELAGRKIDFITI